MANTYGLLAAACLVSIPGLCGAAEAGTTVLGMLPEDLRIGAYVDRGRFQLEDTAVDGESINRLGAKWRVDKQVNDRWSAHLDLHWLFWRNQATDLGLFHIAGLKFDSDLQGSLVYRNGVHRVRGGLYDFKYNPDAKNLGEYLLRTEAYPTILENSQGKDLMAPAFSRVAGIEYGLHLAWLRQTALLYAEQFNVPVNDLSAVWLAEAGPAWAAFRAGAAWHRFLKYGKPMESTTLSPELASYVAKQGLDTEAIKIGLGFRLDAGALLEKPWDLRFYCEAALLGLRNDSLYYRKPEERLPVMAGVDLPGFGILSELGVEAEYLRNPYFGRKYSISDATGSNFSPLPYIDDYASPPRYFRDDLKWSVHARRSLGRWADLRLRFASDHLRMIDWSGDFVSGQPLTRSPRDWYFLARVEFHD